MTYGVDTTDKQQGTGSFYLEYSTVMDVIYVNLAAVDLSNEQILKTYLKTNRTLNNVGYFQLTDGVGSMNYYHFYSSCTDIDLSDTSWQLVDIYIQNPSGSSGTIDLSDINNFQLVLANPSSEYDDGIIWLDYLHYYPVIGSCSDNTQNGDELGIDCGGSCSVCSSDSSHTAPVPFPSTDPSLSPDSSSSSSTHSLITSFRSSISSFTSKTSTFIHSITSMIRSWFN